jgi:hypothetical protein
MSTLNLNVKQVLAMPRMETFTVEGAAPNVLMADQMAWGGLEAILGGDPVAKWALKVMQHEFVPAENSPGGETPCVKFHAEFVRSPVEEGEE